MANLAKSKFDRGGWLQLFEEKEKAGHSSITLTETDVAARLAELRKKGIRIGPTTDGNKVKTPVIADPDGNRIVFAQGMDFAHRSAA